MCSYHEVNWLDISRYSFKPFGRYKEICSDIKGVKIVGQMVKLSYTINNQINAWKKYSHMEHNFAQIRWIWRNIFCEKLIKYFLFKELSGAINMGQLSRRWGNFWRVIIRGTIILAPSVRRAIIWGKLSWGIFLGGQLSWGQFSWRQ